MEENWKREENHLPEDGREILFNRLALTGILLYACFD